MTQITGIGFSNFRVFKEDAFFDFAPITIFTGTNNSGKSSVFKGLMLLKDNSSNFGTLNFSGEHHKLGTFDLAKNSEGVDRKIQFSIGVNVSKPSFSLLNNHICFIDYYPAFNNNEDGYWDRCFFTTTNEIKDLYEEDEQLLVVGLEIDPKETQDYFWVKLNLDFLLNKIKQDLIPQAKQIEIEGQNATKESKIFFSLSPLTEVSSILLNFYKTDFEIISIKKLTKELQDYPLGTILAIAEELTEWVIKYFSYSFINEGFGLEEHGEIVLGTLDQIIQDHFNKFTQTAIGAKKLSEFSLVDILEDGDYLNNGFIININLTIHDVINPAFLDVSAKVIAPALKSLFNACTAEVSKLGYIEAVRANSQRLYTNQSQGTSFNSILLDIGKDWPMSWDKDMNGESAHSFIEKWIKSFGIGERIYINRVKGIATEVQIEKNGKKIDLIDLGYGVTQFLPLLLYIASKYKLKTTRTGDLEYLINKNIHISQTNGPILLIEEPETNLHPKLQSLLADFFVDIATNFKVTFLIETHSEYLIRRLQVLTASGKTQTKDSVIYYINDKNSIENGEDLIKKININSDGSLTNDFGTGFIDEATNWKMELMRLKNAHLQNLN